MGWTFRGAVEQNLLKLFEHLVYGHPAGDPSIPGVHANIERIIY